MRALFTKGTIYQIESGGGGGGGGGGGVGGGSEDATPPVVDSPQAAGGTQNSPLLCLVLVLEGSIHNGRYHNPIDRI